MTITYESTSRFVEVEPGKSLHYHDVGEGFPVVCLHGGGPGASGWANYSRNIEALSQHFRVLAFDLPQFGKSFKGRFDDDLYPSFARVLDRALAVLGVDRAHFIGNSMGGAVSCFTAHFSPARVDRLVLMGPGGVFDSLFQPTPTDPHHDLFAYYNPGPPSEDKLRKLFHSFVYDPSTLTDELIAMRYAASVDPEALAALSDYGIQSLGDVRPILKAITQRTLVIWGLEDRILTLDTPLTFAKYMPNCEVLMYPRTGHWVQWERAADFNRSAIEFLTRP